MAVQITDLLNQMISPDSHMNVKEHQRLLKENSTVKIIARPRDDGPDLSSELGERGSWRKTVG